MQRVALAAGVLLLFACQNASESVGGNAVSEPVSSSAAPPNAASDEPATSVDPEPLSNAAASLEALGQRLVDAINANDDEALAALALSREEYERLWPVLANTPEARRSPATVLWKLAAAESSSERAKILQEHGGANLQFVRIVPGREDARPGITLYVDSRVVVRTQSGAEQELAIVGPVIRHDATSGHKVVTYRLRH